MRTEREMENLTGQRYGRLTVIGETEACGYRGRWVKVFCTCGAVFSVRLSSLTNGRTRSCGCLRRELTSTRTRKNLKTDTPMRYRIEMGGDGLFHARMLVADTVRFHGWKWMDIADGRETYEEAADDIKRHRLRQQ